MKKITLDGVTYVEENREEKNLVDNDFVIVRTESAGVHFGTLAERNGSEVILYNARRTWYWDGAATLSQMSVDGVSKPENCKFPCAVDRITLLGVIEIIPCTKKAIESLNGVQVWSA